MTDQGNPARTRRRRHHHVVRLRRGREPDPVHRREREPVVDHVQLLEPARVADRARHRGVHDGGGQSRSPPPTTPTGSRSRTPSPAGSRHRQLRQHGRPDRPVRGGRHRRHRGPVVRLRPGREHDVGVHDKHASTPGAEPPASPSPTTTAGLLLTAAGAVGFVLVRLQRRRAGRVGHGRGREPRPTATTPPGGWRALNDPATGTTATYSYNQPSQVVADLLRNRQRHPQLRLQQPAPADLRHPGDRGGADRRVDRLRL